MTRVVQFGSEPLFDNVLPHAQLAQQVTLAKQNLSSLHIPVTVSELAYGYQERGGAQDVLDAIDSINIHMLPFFAQTASTCAFSFFSAWLDIVNCPCSPSLPSPYIADIQRTRRGHWLKMT